MADSTLAGLPASGAIGATDLFYNVQGGADTKSTGAQLLAWAQGGVLLAANNLSDVVAATARTNLGLGGAALLAVGTTTGTVTAGDDSRVTGAAQKASNLSDLASAATARTNLGVTATGADTSYPLKANNLSDMTAATMRTNLGVTATGVDTTYNYRANNLSDVATPATALGNLGGQPNIHPGFISGNWYVPPFLTAVGGAVQSIGKITLIPFILMAKCTIANLGCRISTLAAGGNVSLAIYANNAATGRPTGNPVGSVGSLTTGTATVVSAALSGGNTAFNPGVYWAAINCDNTTAIVVSATTSGPSMADLIGSATEATVNSGTTAVGPVLSVTQTFGSWPDLTSASFTEQTTAANTGQAALIHWKVA